MSLPREQSPTASPRTWERVNERSNSGMIAFIIWVARRLGRRVAMLFLYPITAYFLTTSRGARRASAQWLERALGRKPTIRDQWRHLMYFATCTLDRVFLVTGKHRPQVNIVKTKGFSSEQLGGRGCLLLMSHLGSFEALRVPGAQKHQLGLRIVLDRQHNQMLMAAMERLNPQLAAGVIDASVRGPQLVLNLKKALEQGQMLGLMADRVRGDEPTVEVDFLGAPAKIPSAPWLLAGALGVPVTMGVAVYRGDNRYEARLELLFERVELSRDDRQQAVARHAQIYADRLAEYGRNAPYNWFNFFDFWKQ